MKKKILMMVSFGISLLSAGQDLDEVRHLLENERYAKAEALLEEKVNAGAASPEANYLLVKTYLEQEKIEAARLFAEKHQLGKAAEAEEIMNNIAYARYLLATGKKEEAATIFDAILAEKRNKKNPGLLMSIAEAHIDAGKGNLQLALDLLAKAGDKDERNPEIDLLRGNTYRQLGDGSNAYKAYQEALRKDPGNVKANYLLGKIFRTQNNPEMYLPYFMKAYMADSTYAPVLDELYDHYYFRDIRQAKRYFKKYIAHSDYSLQNEYRMTDLLYLNREYAAAVSAAEAILKKEKGEAQPRLYKLIAYSYEAMADSVNALKYLETYFTKESPGKIIGRDYELRAKLTAGTPGAETQAIAYYNRALETDSLAANKVKYASEMAELYRRLGDFKNQAKWLEFVYTRKESKTNLDLFYWGMAHYNAGELTLADSVFAKYTESYPENIYGHYWRGLINAAIDTAMSLGLAVPHYEKTADIGELDKAANKSMLAKAYGYLGAYEANTTKDYARALAWFEKFLLIDSENEDALRYIEILKKWIAEKQE